MCGIAGYANSREMSVAEIVQRMTDAMPHRGPDDQGVWTDSGAGLALGHRRLSILDLSPAGHQPMLSRDGRYALTYNGEVFNYRLLAEELSGDGALFRGSSDTEVILEAFCRWGVEEAVKRFIGMFSMGLWDRETRVLYLIRDRLGIKPLYYTVSGSMLAFSSELKALRQCHGLSFALDPVALSAFLERAYIPAPMTIYCGVRKVTPGSWIRLKLREDGTWQQKEECYWELREVAQCGITSRTRMDEQRGLEGLEGLLTDAVKLRMISDVPLGSFLSGGIDSSLVTALMQSQSSSPIRTFTIGFPSQTYDEASHAESVARCLGTSHTTFTVTPQEAQQVIPLLPAMYDEPFADSSQIPTHLVAALARKQVTVCLSGDGGDELFGGYNRYLWVGTLSRTLRRMPSCMRPVFSRALGMLSPGTVEAIYRSFSRFFPKSLQVRLPADKIAKLAGMVSTASPDELYRRTLAIWPEHLSRSLLRDADNRWMENDSLSLQQGDIIDCMMWKDAVAYLPDDILTKVDRATMAVSLEARLPFLDHRVVEYAWSLPRDLKFREGKGKWVLRRLLSKHIPMALFERPKMGFTVPLDAWLRGPLRDWAEALLDERRLDCEGLFQTRFIRKTWQEHLRGKRNWQHQLWAVLMFQAWAERWSR